MNLTFLNKELKIKTKCFEHISYLTLDSILFQILKSKSPIAKDVAFPSPCGTCPTK